MRTLDDTAPGLPPGYLSPHFSLAELTRSETAERRGMDNRPGPDALFNLKRLVVLLEDVRTLLGAPVLVSSGYRSPDVNRAVKGSLNSAHMSGLAADFIAPRFGSPLDICRLLAEPGGLVFDQLIYEGTWVHIGLARAPAWLRREVRHAVFVKGRPTRYLLGLPK